MADANIAVAATFVASVLENVGYMTQARFLHDFQSFFRDAGALIYTIAGVGAVVATTMYGSTRAVQYLLIGPALFWFLVGPTTKTEGVKWKLGGGQYLGMFREQGEEASDQFRKKVQDKIKENQDQQGQGGEIEVAIGFWLFAKPINDFVNEFVNIILDKENSEDLTAQAKIQGLELIATMLPYDADHIQHLEEFATNCHQYFGAANSAAEIRTRIKGKESAMRSGGNVQGDTTTEAFNTFKTRMDEYGKSQKIKTAGTGYKDLVSWLAKAESGDAKSQVAIKLANDLLPLVINEGDIECKDAWTLLAAETWFKAKAEVPKILETSSGYWNYQSAKEYTCDELTQKTLKDPNAKCALEPAVAMFMLYNHWKSQDTYQRLIGRHRNGKDFTNPKANTIVTGPMARGFAAATMTDQNGVTKPVRISGINEYGQSYLKQLVYNPSDQGKQGFDDMVRHQWMPIAPITELRGMDHAMNVASRQFDTTRLKQQLISYALHLPYYQGVALYMVAIAYPFLALIVLLPGRAPNFLAVPLAWLWLKSWDIGFAVVIVLDKIMYNLLPNWTLGEKLRNGPWTTSDDLIEVMSQGFNFDPWGSIHNYYAIMAMATLSIPALTGVATLKAKKGVLSSFTDGAAAQAKNRADKAASGFSVQAQSERNHMMMQVKALALIMAHGPNGEVDQGGRGRAAGFQAALQTALTTLNKQDLASLAKGDLSVISKMPQEAANTVTRYLENYSEGIKTYAPFASKLSARWDRNVGRAGVIQHMEEAYAAAMDAGGVYEMSGIGESPVEEMLSMMAGQADARIIATGKGIKLGKKVVGDGLSSPAVGAIETAAAIYMGDNVQKNLGLEDLRKLAGAQGMTNEEFLRSTFFMDRFTYNSSPVLQAEIEKLKDHFNDPVTGRLMRDVHAVLTGTDSNSRGGPSSLVDLDLDMMAPDRFLARMPNNNAQGQANANQAAITVDGSSFNVAIDNLENMISQQIGQDPKATYSQVEIETVEGLQLFMNTLSKRQSDLNARMADNFFVGGEVPDFARQQMEIIQADIVDLLGGTASILEYWNSHNIDGKTFDASHHFSAEELVRVIEIKSQDPKEKESFRERITKDYAEGGITLQEQLQIESMTIYQELPQFKYQGNNVGLVQLMEHNPLVTLQVAKEWASHNAGVTKSDSMYLAPDSSIMTNPGQYFNDSSYTDTKDRLLK